MGYREFLKFINPDYSKTLAGDDPSVEVMTRKKLEEILGRKLEQVLTGGDVQGSGTTGDPVRLKDNTLRRGPMPIRASTTSSLARTCQINTSAQAVAANRAYIPPTAEIILNYETLNSSGVWEPVNLHFTATEVYLDWGTSDPLTNTYFANAPGGSTPRWVNGSTGSNVSMRFIGFQTDTPAAHTYINSVLKTNLEYWYDLDFDMSVIADLINRLIDQDVVVDVRLVIDPSNVKQAKLKYTLRENETGILYDILSSTIKPSNDPGERGVIIKTTDNTIELGINFQDLFDALANDLEGLAALLDLLKASLTGSDEDITNAWTQLLQEMINKIVSNETMINNLTTNIVNNLINATDPSPIYNLFKEFVENVTQVIINNAEVINNLTESVLTVITDPTGDRFNEIMELVRQMIDTAMTDEVWLQDLSSTILNAIYQSDLITNLTNEVLSQVYDTVNNAFLTDLIENFLTEVYNSDFITELTENILNSVYTNEEFINNLTQNIVNNNWFAVQFYPNKAAFPDPNDHDPDTGVKENMIYVDKAEDVPYIYKPGQPAGDEYVSIGGGGKVVRVATEAVLPTPGKPAVLYIIGNYASTGYSAIAWYLKDTATYMINPDVVYVKAHIDNVNNPHSTTLQQAATTQGATPTTETGGIYEGSNTAQNKLLTRAEVQAEIGFPVRYKGQLKYGAMTIADMNNISTAAAANNQNLQIGDTCGVQATQLTYRWNGTTWDQLPQGTDTEGDLYDLLFWWGTWVDGKAYSGEVSAQIKCKTSGPPASFDLVVLTDLLLDNEVTDPKIGSRTLADQAADTSLIGIAAKTLTTWLQGIRNNLKGLFGLTDGLRTDLMAEASTRAAADTAIQGNLNTLTNRVNALGGTYRGTFDRTSLLPTSGAWNVNDFVFLMHAPPDFLNMGLCLYVITAKAADTVYTWTPHIVIPYTDQVWHFDLANTALYVNTPPLP